MKKQIMNTLMRQMIPSAGTIIVVALMLFGYRAWAMPAAAPASPNDTPGVISYQGYLTDQAGQPVTGDKTMVFRLFNVSEGGTYPCEETNQSGCLWIEWHTGTNEVPVGNGVFNVLLGSLEPIPSSVWSNSQLYLSVAVGLEDLEMTPREPVGMVPIALHAVRASGLSAADGTPGDAVTVDEAGNVGIGTTDPKKTLHVDGDYYGKGHLWLHAHGGDGQSGTAYIQARDDSGSSDIDLQFRSQKQGQIKDVMRLSVDGKVGIGTTDPQSELHVKGDVMLEDSELLISGVGKPIDFNCGAFGGGESIPIYRTYPLWLCGVVGFRSYGHDIDEHGWEGYILYAYTYVTGNDWRVTADIRHDGGAEKSESWRVCWICVRQEIASHGDGFPMD